LAEHIGDAFRGVNDGGIPAQGPGDGLDACAQNRFGIRPA
jgi:hypothetical protein